MRKQCICLVGLAFLIASCAGTPVKPAVAVAPCLDKPRPPEVTLALEGDLMVSPAPASQDEAFVQVTRNCGLRRNGTIACIDTPTALPPPGMRFKSLATNFVNFMSRLCGVTFEGVVHCWDPGLGFSCQKTRTSAPEATYTEMTGGFGFQCGLRSDGTVQCWGQGDCGETNPPAGRFRQIHAAASSACGVREDGGVACWGLNVPEGLPKSGIERVYTFGESVCGLHSNGTSECWAPKDFAWGSCAAAQEDEEAKKWVTGSVHSLTGSGGAAGAVGGIATGLSTYMAGEVNADAKRHFKALKAAYPERRKKLVTPPPGLFRELCGNSQVRRGLRTDGTLYRSSIDDDVLKRTALRGNYVSMDVDCGECAVRADGRIACPGRGESEALPAVSSLPQAQARSLEELKALKNDEKQIKNGDSKADVERLLGKPVQTMVVAGTEMWIFVKTISKTTASVTVAFDANGKVSAHSYAEK